MRVSTRFARPCLYRIILYTAVIMCEMGVQELQLQRTTNLGIIRCCCPGGLIHGPRASRSPACRMIIMSPAPPARSVIRERDDRCGGKMVVDASRLRWIVCASLPGTT